MLQTYAVGKALLSNFKIFYRKETHKEHKGRKEEEKI